MYSTTRSLRRSLYDRKLAGVCAGIARYFGLDVTLVRLGWVLFTLLGGSGMLAYLIAWAIIPDEAGQRTATPLIIVLLTLILPFLCFLLLIPVRIIAS